MNNATSMWQTELWHPLIVHLPVATLLLASVAGLFSYTVSNAEWRKFIRRFTGALLLIGVVTGWAAIYTGQLAYNIEVRKICDPKMLQQHQWWSYFTIIAYTVALVLLFLQERFGSKSITKVISVFYGLLLMTGLAGLLYAGHLGAEVVYRQGAGVFKPKNDCSDYIVK